MTTIKLLWGLWFSIYDVIVAMLQFLKITNDFVKSFTISFIHPLVREVYLQAFFVRPRPHPSCFYFGLVFSSFC